MNRTGSIRVVLWLISVLIAFQIGVFWNDYDGTKNATQALNEVDVPTTTATTTSSRVLAAEDATSTTIRSGCTTAEETAKLLEKIEELEQLAQRRQDELEEVKQKHQQEQKAMAETYKEAMKQATKTTATATAAPITAAPITAAPVTAPPVSAPPIAAPKCVEEVSSKSSSASSSSTTVQKQQQHQDGWHSIDVFYGNSSHLDRKLRGNKIPAPDRWWAQAKQDQIVAELFRNKRNGYFIDLAANDAREISNSYSLEKRLQWTGLCIEPNPLYWYDLAYRDCQVVAAAVGRDRMEEVLFHLDKGPYGGIVKKTFDNKEHHDGAKTESTPKFTVPLLEILERYNTPKIIDYLSLDVEGAKEYVMSVFPIDDYKFRLMTVERPKDGLKKFLKDHGYHYIKKLSGFGETLWAHDSFIKEVGLDFFQSVTGYNGTSLY